MLSRPNRIRAVLETAFARRGTIRERATSWRLTNGAVDGILGLEIDVHENGTFFVRTHDAKADALLDAVTACLAENFAAKTVWLKNDFAARANHKLERGDRVLFGDAPATINITENAARYVWPTDRTDLFPLIDRPLRRELNDFLATIQNYESVLLAGFDPAALIAQGESRRDTKHVATNNLDIAQATDLMRHLATKESASSFSACALDFTFVRNVTKNRTALFHFWIATFALLASQAHLFIKTTHAQECNALIAAVANKRRRRCSLLKEESPDADFPRQMDDFHRQNPVFLHIALDA